MIGKLSDEIVEAVFEHMPLQISILDKDDKVLGWNKHETRIFKRPESVVGKDVRNCHPEKSLSKVEQIISEMKKGTRENAQFYIDLPIGPNKQKHKVLIEYYALRDKDDEYIGCLEASQDIEEIQHLKGEKRLLD
jgi:uncharacterized protein